MNKKISAMALAVAGAMLVVGCGGGGGGGGGGGSEAPAPAPVTSSMTVAPSLGKFNTSCSVEALKADGSVLDSVKVGADGKAVLSFVKPEGPIVVRVKGADGCQYFDEAAKAPRDFVAGRLLNALLAEFRAEVGVHVLTHLAASGLVTSAGKLETGVTPQAIRARQEETRLRFLQDGAGLFDAPVLIGSESDRVTSTDPASRLAIVLAVLSGLVDVSNPDTAAGQLQNTDSLGNFATNFGQKLAEIAEKYAPSVKAELVAKIEAPKSAEDVTDDVTEVVYENEIDQARTMLRALREQILAMSNTDGTGSLDKQWDRMRDETTNQLELLGAIDELEVLTEAASVMVGVYPGAAVDTTQTFVWGYEGECQIENAGNSANCRIYRDGSMLEVGLDKAADGRVGWNLLREEFWGAYHGNSGETTYTGYTGTIGFTGTTARLSGRYAPMAAGAVATLVDVDVTVSGDQEVTKDYKLQGTGVLSSVGAQDTSLFKAEIASLSFDMGGVAGKIVSPTLDVTLVASSPNFRFTGRLETSGVLESQAPGQDWIDYQPAVAKLSGKFENVPEQFTLFDGLFTLSQNWSNGYKPYEDESASNFAKLQGSFVGTLFEAKDKAGLTLNLGAKRDGWLKESLSFDFATGNGVALQGSAARMEGSPADPEWIWNLASSNGVKLSYSEYSQNGEVLAADGRKLGSIGRDMVSFIDGTSESLF